MLSGVEREFTFIKFITKKKLIKENEQIENELNLSYDGKRITRRISFPHIAIAI